MSLENKKTFDVLIEIPKGSRNKYEYDFDLNKIRFDRMLFSSMMYPADYGFVPETLALDDDPLDVLVLGHEPTFPMCVIEVKPIGVFHMTDEKGPDEKIICVPISDPIWNNKNDISDLNPHRLKEIEHFFQVYKDLEEKKVDTGGWGNAEEAIKIYRWFMPLLELDIHPKLVQYIKLAAALTGIGSEHVRAPRLPLVGEERERILKVINDGIATRPVL